MTYVEFAKKLGINLTSAQIEMLNLIEEHKGERLTITFPRMAGRQMLYNLIERKKGYEQGRADREKEVLNYLVDNGYIRYGFDAEYLAEQLKEK